MENFKDLPLWRQCYKIAFPGIYDENDTYEEAEIKKAYKMRDLVGGVVSNNIIPDKSTYYNIGSDQLSFDNVFLSRILKHTGSGNYSYDNIINNSTKLNIINNFEFSYSIESTRYSAKVKGKTFDDFSIYKASYYADYLTLIALKLDNLNRRVKVLEENK